MRNNIKTNKPTRFGFSIKRTHILLFKNQEANHQLKAGKMTHQNPPHNLADSRIQRKLRNTNLTLGLTSADRLMSHTQR